MIEAIFRKCTSTSIITKYNSLLNSLKDSMMTNMPIKSITKFAKMQLRDGSSWVITANSLAGVGSSEYTYTYPGQALYVTLPDEESLKLTKSLIQKVTDGEVLESSYTNDTNNVHSVTKSNVSKSNNNKKTTTKVKEAEINPVAEPKEITCSNGKVDNGSGSCVCPSGTTEEGDTCVAKTCTNGKVENENGDCVCPENTVEENGACVDQDSE